MAEPLKDTASVASHAREDSSIELGHAPKPRIVTDAEKRAVRKLDYSIVPVMTMFYLLSFLVILFSNCVDRETDSHDVRTALILVKKVFLVEKLCTDLVQEMRASLDCRKAWVLRTISIKSALRSYTCMWRLPSYHLATILIVRRPYIAAELPSNLLLRWVGPRLLMPTILTAWGIVVTLQGAFSNVQLRRSGC